MSIGSVQDKQKEIAFFDAHASSDEYDVFTPEASARLISAFVRLSGLPRGARVADLGCGSGVFTELLRRAGYAGVGLDISPKLVALGRSKYPGLELMEGDAENLPFGAESLDGVLLSGLVHHFSRPAAARRRGPPRPQARWPFRRLRPQPHEPVHVALSRSRLALLQSSRGHRE
jgi:ubiquinone/menaquinone biosynthesis C-methylase UbiE